MLSIVATPIGNLKDITLRALETLKAADEILCEDTRQTQKLLSHYEISKPLTSFHEHSTSEKTLKILERLKQGARIALVSDGGMPLVSDPGFELVHEAIKQGIAFEVLPGASACLTALVASGLATDSFLFYGFLSPKSAARKHQLEKLADREETLIFYESPYRVVKALQDMLEVLGDREAAVVRELTKKFEECQRGDLSSLIVRLSKKEVIGEVVILVSGKDRKKILS